MSETFHDEAQAVPNEGHAGLGAVRRSWPYTTWGPKAAVLGALLAILLGLFLAVPALVAFAPEDGEDLGVLGATLAQLCTGIGFLAVPFFLALRPGGGLRAAFGRLGFRSFDSSAIGWILVAGVGYILFVALWATFVMRPEQEEIAERFGSLPVQAVMIVGLASISEEVCFRGMLFGGLRHRLGRITAALAAASVFGVLHVTTGVSAVPPLIAFGFALALLYEKTGSLWPPIILHALNNSLALAAAS